MDRRQVKSWDQYLSANQLLLVLIRITKSNIFLHYYD